MFKRSHMEIARKLILNMEGFKLKRFEYAFVIGSFEPDINPFTYTRGLLRYRGFIGHTYNGIRPYMDKFLARLKIRDQWNIIDYYRLGKLIHYMTDSFTYPHNNIFNGTLIDHHVYEGDIQQKIKKKINSVNFKTTNNLDDILKYFDDMHSEYIATKPSITNDIRFASLATYNLVENFADYIKEL